MYVNGLLTTTHNSTFWNVDGITYTTPAVMCAALEITRRDAEFNADTQILTFSKNGDHVTVSSEEIRKNDIIILNTGFDPNLTMKTMPINSIVIAFGGTYEENAEEIEIIYP
jgi:hypothetical protein